jgi:hypothetical protein
MTAISGGPAISMKEIADRGADIDQFHGSNAPLDSGRRVHI